MKSKPRNAYFPMPVKKDFSAVEIFQIHTWAANGAGKLFPKHTKLEKL